MRKGRGLIRVWSGLEGAAQELLDLFFPLPPVCAGCGGPLGHGERLLCESCRRGIALVTEPTCAHCGRPLTHSGLCARCRQSERAFARAWPAALYRGPLRNCLHRLKYGRETRLVPFLAGLVLERLGVVSGLPAAPLVVPVPLDPERLRERGFNQAELLARFIARERGWALAAAALRRTRATRPQSDLTAAEREANVAGAFAAGKEARDKEILLVDDIYTTGATAEAAACALLAAGARAVYVTTVAVASSHPQPHPGSGLGLPPFLT